MALMLAHAAFGQTGEGSPSLKGAPDTDLPAFVNVTKQAGIRFLHSIGDDHLDNIVEGTGAGCGFLDYDNDGDLDIYAVNGCYLREVNDVRGRRLRGKLKNHLYRNNGDGTFTDVTDEAGVGDTGYGMGCIAADYDNDGFVDLFVTNYGRNTLYHNNGDGTFADVTIQAGVGDERWGIGAVFLDYDRDGNLDLYVGNYLQFDPKYRYFYAPEAFPGPLSYPGQADILYRNNGDGTFTDVSKAARIDNPEGRAMGISAGDCDNDGDIDIFVANDAMENYLYRNDGGGRFTNVAREAGVAFGENGEATSAMGPDFGDINRDGLFDLVVPDMQYACVYRSIDGANFEDITDAVGVARVCGQYTDWACDLFDYDNDGWLDLFIVNGHAHRLDTQEDVLFRNIEGRKLEDVSARSGPYFREKHVGRGAAFGDYDNDGDIDAFIINLNSRAVLVRNDGGNRKNWLMVKTVGTKSNRSGVGARVTVVAGRATQFDEVKAASGYLSQNDLRVHFGLGKNASANLVEVRWPSGIVQRIKNVKANQVLTVVEPNN